MNEIPAPEAVKKARQLGYAAAMRYAVANSTNTKEASAESKVAKVKQLVADYGVRLTKRASKIGKVYDAIVQPV